jgi:hypothetical protein
MSHPVFTFETTHMALWAEEVAQENDIPAEVVPAPPASRARCNLALTTLERFVAPLVTALEVAGVEFHPPAGSNDQGEG